MTWPWVARKTFEGLNHAFERMQNMTLELQRQLTASRERERVLQAEIRAALTEIGDLKQEAARARGEAQTAKAYSDLLRLRVNELTRERAALMLKLAPDLNIPVPTIERVEGIPPSPAIFEDMGDDWARLHGLEQVRAGMAGPDPVPAPADLDLDPREQNAFAAAGLDTRED